MFFRLISIEWTRLSRRAVLWVTLIACLLYSWLGVQNYYSLTGSMLRDGTEKMPGLAFDIATSLDVLLLVSLPLIIIMAGLVFGGDYSQRTNHNWLMRVSRSNSLLAKFVLLAGSTLLVHALVVVLAGVTGWYYKTYAFHATGFLNVNWVATISAIGYMTLVLLPYIALMALIIVATRSTFAGIVIGLGVTQFVEMMFTVLTLNVGWGRWAPRNLYFSATYLLNAIGDRFVETPPNLLAPVPTFITAAIYTLILLSLAIWLYRRQDIGG